LSGKTSILDAECVSLNSYQSWADVAPSGQALEEAGAVDELHVTHVQYL